MHVLNAIELKQNMAVGCQTGSPGSAFLFLVHYIYIHMLYVISYFYVFKVE